jgi:DNA repair ATPase RecN
MMAQSVSLSSLGGDQVTFYLSSQVVSQPVKAALQKLVGLQQKVSDTVSQRTRQETRVNEIVNDQTRIGANMERLSQSSDLYKTYVKTLTDQEGELARLREEIAKLRDQEASQRKVVDAFIQSLEVS